MKNFHSFSLPSPLSTRLDKMGYTIPTPIQAQAIPYALEGRDILASAQTGTGKTAAFAIPTINHLFINTHSRALILAPTRELATQIFIVIRDMTKRIKGLQPTLLIGGESMFKQVKALQYHPRILVGTPGRINDHLAQETLTLNNIDHLILDEMDRMLDMGFLSQLKRIFAETPKNRQTLMFTATLPKNIEKIAHQYAKNPIRIEVGGNLKVADTVEQKILRLEGSEKFPTLSAELNERTGSIIVFAKTKRGAAKLAYRIKKQLDIKAEAIHGDLRQNQRDKILKQYRDYQFPILVATDVAARGLDIPHIEHVINYDLPQLAEDFIHRLGRTGRNGATGHALSLITPNDHDKWFEIQKLLKQNENNAPITGDKSKKIAKKKKKKKRPYGRFKKTEKTM